MDDLLSEYLKLSQLSADSISNSVDYHRVVPPILRRLGLLAGSLGKIAKDLVLISQFGVAEVAEAVEPGRVGPATMPYKHNPVACMVVIAAAQRAPQRVAVLLAAMQQEH